MELLFLLCFRIKIRNKLDSPRARLLTLCTWFVNGRWLYFQKSREWDAQFENYQKLFDYVNSKPELNAELKFGTLEDYFDEIRKQSLVRFRTF
jgi:hypothetical protein